MPGSCATAAGGFVSTPLSVDAATSIVLLMGVEYDSSAFAGGCSSKETSSDYETTYDECAFISSRLKGRRAISSATSRGTEAMLDAPRYEDVSYRDMEPVHYRLLEGTYLSSLEFGLSQIPPGDPITLLLRPENRIRPKSQPQLENQVMPDDQTGLKVQQKSHDEDRQIDSAQITSEIQLITSDPASLDDASCIENNSSISTGTSTSSDDSEDSYNERQEDEAQNCNCCNEESAQAVEVGQDKEANCVLASAKDGDAEASDNVPTQPSTSEENFTSTDACSQPAVTVHATSENAEMPENVRDEKQEDQTCGAPQRTLPLVVPINDEFEIRNQSMGGSGAFARKDLKFHDVIMVEKYILDGNGFTIQRQFRDLDALAQRAYLCLYPHWDKNERPTDILSAICHTNSFSIHGGKAVFPVASRFNHKCRTKCNLLFHYDRISQLLVVYVGVAHISAGEELTISYGGSPQTLYQRYGFFCSCGGCSGFSTAKADALERLNWV